MNRAVSSAAICLAVLLAGTPALAHRLDQYLQGTIMSIEKNRVDAQITLTPGVAVFSIVMADLDANADGVLSESEQRAYAGRVLRDISVAIDGRVLIPHILSIQFPAIQEMKEGGGEIRIEFDAALPDGGSTRKLTFENHHQSSIAAYQVNCLVPRDPDIRIAAQNRNYSQWFYELEFTQAERRSSPWNFAWLEGIQMPLGTGALILLGWLALLSSRRRV